MSREDGERARATAEVVARRSYGKLISFLAARTRDVAGAEDALSEAFAAALIGWVTSGIPANPEAWLLTVARRKMIDASRRRRSAEDGSTYLQLIADEVEAAAASDAPIPDDRLRLMFACAHPAIEPAVRAPLMLQAILGFDAGTIASAFLVAPATMSQRLVRAKSKIRQAGIPFHVPERNELRERLEAVLEAIYAVFAEGWSDPAGTEARRRNLAEEGIWLGRLVVSLLPDQPEALGLLALMLHAEARRGARRDAQGEYVPARGSGSRLVGCAVDRRGRSAAVACERNERDRPLSTGSCGAIGACDSAADWTHRLGGDRADLRCVARDHRFAGGGDQPCRCIGGDPRARGGTRGTRRSGERCAARRLSALLGGTCGIAITRGRGQRSRGCVSTRDRPRIRSGGPPLFAAALPRPAPFLGEREYPNTSSSRVYFRWPGSPDG